LQNSPPSSRHSSSVQYPDAALSAAFSAGAVELLLGEAVLSDIAERTAVLEEVSLHPTNMAAVTAAVEEAAIFKKFRRDIFFIMIPFPF